PIPLIAYEIMPGRLAGRDIRTSACWGGSWRCGLVMYYGGIAREWYGDGTIITANIQTDIYHRP
ncbi:MAG: hypothetical protein WBM23_12005, partial [Desulfomonilia bacterium]